MRPAIVDKLPRFFVDPATRLRPTNERECTALLWAFHQSRRVDWSSVRLIRENLSGSGLTVASLFTADSTLYFEYPLFSTPRFGEKHWGDMRADFLLFSPATRHIAVFECKLSARFTSDGTAPRTGQLARLATFLRHCEAEARSLVLLCPAITDAEDRFAVALRNALKYSNGARPIKGFLAFWEDVVDALREEAV